MNDPQHLDEAFDEVAKELKEIFIKKHRDYGKGNIIDTGELGIAFRISDKLNRLKHLLINHKKPENESIEETWTDIAVYAIIAVLYKRSWFKRLELKEKK
ncbi:hypothetical protein A3D06_01600 [Candidatus Roizmanbacteria bacterium RIFCSPHIGHO2_02_FULL_40_9]|uniref:Nucleotide modification associated domain-containing protein n=2 Tax=Candidatus Roizmaniibacteriota TaxID=1752723 RepID=A0A1F7INA5_9BACT|nr:MAG: hypothetical protein A3D06_01600 [Candidatus Roizmanbacteria bacterium RIFCSPHIGHO2_02_FULL_40_9]OGK44810.1 MAG: hypothetical protein A2957_01050 [Candidatus Roizmanbacteria bacterium RIFCSPLOWO2_01_FULL_38_11]